MRSFLLLLLLTVQVFAQTATTQTTFKNQNDTTYLTGKNKVIFDGPVDSVDGSTVRLNSGNDNLLINPNGEGPVTKGWTTSVTGTGATATVTSINAEHPEFGKKTLALNCTTTGAAVSSCVFKTVGASTSALQGLISTFAKQTLTNLLFFKIKVCPIVDNVTLTQYCRSDLPLNSTTPGFFLPYTQLQFPVTLGRINAGLEVTITNSDPLSGTASLYVDNSYAGKADFKASSALVTPWQDFTPTGTWTSNSTYKGKWRQVGENAEIQMSVFTTAAPNAVQLGFNLPSNLTIDTNKLTSANPSRTIGLASALSNGTYYPGWAYFSTTNQVFAAFLRAPSSANHDVAFANQAVPNTFGGNASDRVDVQFTVPIVGFLNTSSYYSSRSSNTGWGSCTFATNAWQGLGNVDSSQLRCKRQGGDLLMRGKFLGGTITNVQAKFPLPTWNGTQLTTKASAIQSISSVGRVLRDRAVVNNIKDFVATAEGGLTYFYASYPEFTQPVSPIGSLSAADMFGSNEFIGYDNIRIPIAEWDDTEFILGQFNGLESCKNTDECTDFYSAYVTTANPATFSEAKSNWITSCTRVVDGRANCVIKAGLLTATPKMGCTVNNTDGDTVNLWCRISNVTNTSFTVHTGYSIPGNTTYPYTVSVWMDKANADSIGKTAKAVASDQNVRIPGVLNAASFVIKFGGGSGYSSGTNCSSSTCTVSSNLGNLASSVTRVTTGSYKVNLNTALLRDGDTRDLSCTCSAVVWGNAGGFCRMYLNSADLDLAISTTGTNALDGSASVTCTGVLK